MSVRKSSHGTIFLIVSSGSPRALIASSLRSTSKKPVCPMTRSLHPPMTAHDHRVRFVATWREEFFEVPECLVARVSHAHAQAGHERIVFNIALAGGGGLEGLNELVGQNTFGHGSILGAAPGPRNRPAGYRVI